MRTLERYRRGLSTYVAVVEAAHLVVQTQTTRLRAAVALVQALGGGWQDRCANEEMGE